MSRRRRTAARVISFLIAFIMVLAMGASIFASGKHTVRSGESWWSIGQRYGVSYLEIARANGRLPSQHIYLGEVLTIPNKGGGNPASPTPKPTSPPTSSQSSTHKVQRGETWWSISIKYGVNMNTLAQANGKNTQQFIFVGEVLIIPGRSSVTPTKTPTKAPTAAPTTAPTNPPSSGSSKTHTVQRGETWWSIGLKYGLNYHTLAQANGKTAQQYIFIGEVLIIPGTAPAQTATPKPTAAPTATPKPTAAPTATPKPTAAPTAAPTVAPTPIPDLTVVTVAETTDPRMAAESNKYKVIMAPTLFANGPDGGLGLGMMIKTPNNKTIMIDGGMQLYYDGTTQVDPAPGTGELAKVKNWLATHANNQVDTWIISHPHNDHIRVPAEIIHEGSVGIGHVFGVEYPKEIHDAKVGDENPAQSARAYDALKLVQSQGKYTEITAGMTTSVDGVNIQFLNAYNPDLWRENDSSAVLRISFDGSDKVILLLVDIQEEGAARLMSRYPGLLRADVVQMSHHGMDPLTDLYAAIAAPIILIPASGKVRAKSTVQANTAALASRGSTNYFADGVWTIVEVAKK